MQITDYQTKYFAYDITRRCAPDSADTLAGAVAGAQVDLNPHQVDAALFAFSSPLSKGALLADEVGLGKLLKRALSFRSAGRSESAAYSSSPHQTYESSGSKN